MKVVKLTFWMKDGETYTLKGEWDATTVSEEYGVLVSQESTDLVMVEEWEAEGLLCHRHVRACDVKHVVVCSEKDKEIEIAEGEKEGGEEGATETR